MTGHMFIFGLGFTGLRFARALRSQGWRVGGTVRGADKAAALRGEGIDAHAFDGTAPLAAALLGKPSHVLVTIPPDDGEPPDPVLRHHGDDLAANPDLQWLGYLSSTGVYGDHQGTWVDEQSTVGGGRRVARLVAEAAWRDFSGPITFRLPGIYGPGRSALEKARDDSLILVDAPEHMFSRVHVDDIVGALSASIAKPHLGAIYNIADDEPAPTMAVGAYAYQLLGKTPPAPRSLADAELSPAARAYYHEHRRVCNRLAKAELGWEPLYPSYREGLKACLS